MIYEELSAGNQNAKSQSIIFVQHKKFLFTHIVFTYDSVLYYNNLTQKDTSWFMPTKIPSQSKKTTVGAFLLL